MYSVSTRLKNTMKSDAKRITAYADYGEARITEADDLKRIKIISSGGICRTVMRQAEVTYWGGHDLLGKDVFLGMGVAYDGPEYSARGLYLSGVAPE